MQSEQNHHQRNNANQFALDAKYMRMLYLVPDCMAFNKQQKLLHLSVCTFNK